MPQSVSSRQHHKIVVIGGGSAGITVAARLRRAGETGVAVIDPATEHYYQPLWTLVGGGLSTMAKTMRKQADVMPKGVTWLQSAAASVDPEAKTVSLADGGTVSYDFLVVCPGIQLDWQKVPGLWETLGKDGVSSNYLAETAPKTWEFVRDLRKGTAVFGMPSGPIKCAGAPQKIAYLAADYWRQQGVLDDIRVVLVLPTPGMFGVPVFAKELERVAKGYGIEVHFNSEVIEVDPGRREALVKDSKNDTKDIIGYDVMHVVPPQSSPDWLKATALADPDNPAGYVQVDKNTMQHTRYPDVFALGDAGSTPNSKTGAAIRKQAPVVVENLRAVMAGKAPTASYDGYSSCPLTTARNKMLLAEFDYTMEPKPSFPFIDTTKERKDMWLLKKYGLPALYWNLMLKGRA
ncbi:MAG: FAD/NAD(P)-binding oxidoreductase [Mycobacteriales bacterium]